MGGIRIGRGVVGIKKEGTPYTFDEPTVTYPAFDIEFEAEGNDYERQETNVHFGKKAIIPGTAMGTIRFKLLMTGGGTPLGTAPYFADFLLACGLRQELTSPTKADYKPWSTFDGGTGAGPPAHTNPSKAYSVAIWRDGVRYSIVGAMGNVKWNCKSGEPVVMEFEFKGAYHSLAVATDAEIAPTAVTLVPPNFLSATLTVHTFAAVFENFTLDLGNVLSSVINANSSAGILGALVTDRRISASIDPEMEVILTHDWFGRWRSGANGAISIGPVGGTAGSKFTLTIPESQYKTPALGEREGIQIVNIDIAVINTGSVDGTDFVLSFT